MKINYIYQSKKQLHPLGKRFNWSSEVTTKYWSSTFPITANNGRSRHFVANSPVQTEGDSADVSIYPVSVDVLSCLFPQDVFNVNVETGFLCWTLCHLCAVSTEDRDHLEVTVLCNTARDILNIEHNSRNEFTWCRSSNAPSSCHFSCREEAISQTGNPTNKSSMEMENHVFQKAKTRVRLQSKVIN